MMLGVAPSAVERMDARDILRLERYAAHRPCGPEHLDLLQALISSAILAGAGARGVTPRDCLPAWFEGASEEERVYSQALGVIDALGNREKIAGSGGSADAVQ